MTDSKPEKIFQPWDRLEITNQNSLVQVAPKLRELYGSLNLVMAILRESQDILRDLEYPSREPEYQIIGGRD